MGSSSTRMRSWSRRGTSGPRRARGRWSPRAGRRRAGRARRPTRPRFDVDFEYGVPDLRSFPMRDWLWAMGVAGRTATAADLGDEHGTGATQLRECSPHTCAGCEEPSPTRSRYSSARVPLRPQPPAARPALRGRDHGRSRGSGAGRPRRDRPALRYARGAGPRRPARPRGGGSRRPGRRRDPGTPGADRGRARTGAAARAGRVGSRRGRVRRRGRLRRRVPLRPAAGRRGPGSPDRVVTMGSTSKTLSPTLRMGWLVCPPRLHEAVGVEKQLLGRGALGSTSWRSPRSSSPDATTDTCARCAASTRAGEALVEALARYAPDVAVTGLAAGCHAVLRLPAGVPRRTRSPGARAPLRSTA